MASRTRPDDSDSLQTFLDRTTSFSLRAVYDLMILNWRLCVEPVNVITCDGRVIVGILKGFDQAMNVALSHCHERIFSLETAVSVTQLGVYLIRGDNVYDWWRLVFRLYPSCAHRDSPAGAV